MWARAGFLDGGASPAQPSPLGLASSASPCNLFGPPEGLRVEKGQMEPGWLRVEVQGRGG